MKKSFVRRSIAAVASAGLLLVGIPLTTAPAQAQTEACALGATCQGELPGTLGTGSYLLKMPKKFNGTVMMFAHGYRFSVPVPAALDLAIGGSSNPYYTPFSVPALAATPLESAAAFVALNTPELATSPQVEARLLAQGYALAGIGYARQGWAVAEGVEAGENLIRAINGGLVPGKKRIVTWGNSMGANVAMTLAERNPNRVSGVLGNCGAYAGAEQLLDNAMTLLFSWKTLLAPNLKLANYTPGDAGYAEALTDVLTIVSLARGVSAGQSTAPTGLPIPQANMLGSLLAGFPTKGEVFDGMTVNPAVDTLFKGNPSAASAEGYSPATAGASSAAAMLGNAVQAAFLGVFARYDLEMRARQALRLAPSVNANFTDNVPVRYTRLLTSEQRGEFDSTINVGFPNGTNVMLAQLDASVGDPAIRFQANPAVVQFVRGLPTPTGTYRQPTVLLTTTNDVVTPEGNQALLENRLNASFKKQGKSAGLNKIVSLYTVPRVNGYTRFAPDAKSADPVASAAANVSGVGHCQFNALRNGIQVVNAVGTLARLMDAKTQKQVDAARSFGLSTPLVNRDSGYVPGPLKRPLATAAR
jgi:pimeloyl-ACP methyl ester carboxylesterase